MPEFIEGNLNADLHDKYCIVLSRFNSFIGERLLSGALDELSRHGVQADNIDVIKVPGAFEIPLLAQKAAESKKYSAIITLGAVIRGETPHFDYVAAELSKGIANVSLKYGVPVLFGVLTCDNTDQAIDRAGTKSGNKGSEAAKAALETVSLLKRLN